MKILVVGAGFAGGVIARELAEAGHSVKVIDSRDHVAGNAYDYVNEYGIRVHKYGPHIWHTSNEEAHAWFSKFTDWIPYQHKVQAVLGDGQYVPLPVNRESINKALGLELKTNEEAEAFIKSEQVKYEKIENSRQHVEAAVGKRLCDIFFAPYTKKMWGIPLEELSASVAGRIPTTVSDEALYFPNDKFQAMPKDGYTTAFEKMLDHPNIEVQLNTFLTAKLESEFDHVFNSMPIDVYFENKFGPLPYRSLKFETVTVPVDSLLPVPTVNFTTTGKSTRVTEWKNYPGHGDRQGFSTITFENPCDYADNNFERFYPVKDADGKFRKIYQKYAAYAEENCPNMTFIGRMGLYAYLDMHQSISTALTTARKFLEKNNV